MSDKIEVEIRVLTWKNPFPYLMLPPYNKIETRTWDTKYRGWVAIHAGVTPYSNKDLQEICGNQYEHLMDTITDMEFMKGVIVGIGYLKDSRPMTPDDEDQAFVECKPGLYAHVYEKVQPIRPIVFKGKQGWARLNQGFIRENIPIKMFETVNKHQLDLF